MKIGARTLKTGLAITLSLGISIFFDIGPAIFAAITAMVNLQPSVYQSYKNALGQISVTGLGIVIGSLVALTIGNSPIAVGLASVLVISLALKLKWDSVILIGVVTTIFILDAPTTGFIAHVTTRILLIAIGLSVALVINIFLAPPRFLDRTISSISDFHHQTTEFFNEEIVRFVQRSQLEKERIARLEQLLNNGVQIQDLIGILKHEVENGFDSQALREEKKKQAILLEQLYLLNIHMLNKISLLQDIMPSRLKRRATRGNLPYSQEFKQIITIIIAANNCISDNAKQLKKLIINGEKISTLKNLEKFDESLDHELEEWHNKHLGDHYYLHALMEVSMVIYELRWIYSEQYRLIHKAGVTQDIDAGK